MNPYNNLWKFSLTERKAQAHSWKEAAKKKAKVEKNDIQQEN